MTTGPNQGEDSALAADTTEPESDTPDLDLRDEPAATGPDTYHVPSPAPGTDPEAQTVGPDAKVTLASLAYRLFATIESQLDRDPNAGVLTALASRLDAIERGLASADSRAETLAELGERLAEVEDRLAAPDPHAGTITSLDDRLAAVEHRLAAPHPHTATINSLIERVEAMETKESLQTIDALNHRIDFVESQVPGTEAVTQLGDRLIAVERSMPEVVTALTVRLDAFEERLATLETPPERRLTTRRLVLYVLVVLIVATAVTVGFIAAA